LCPCSSDILSAGLTDESYGLLLVRRIRNNLFHGAKFLLGGERDFDRDRQLVEAALTVLDVAMNPFPANMRQRHSDRGAA
jgi:hypothetical protein